MLSLTLLTLALASPLDEARAWSMLHAGDADGALALARASLEEGPTLEAGRVYFEAATALGLGGRAVAELATTELPPDPVEVAAEPLRAAVRAGDAESARAAARALHKAHPDHPEALLPLWSPAVDTPAVVRERRRLLARLERSFDDPLVGLRVHRLHWEAGEPLPEVDLAAAGVPVAPHPPLSDVARHRAAEAAFPGPDLPAGLERRTRLDVLLRLHRMLVDAGRSPDAVALWAAHPDLAHEPPVRVARAELAPVADMPWGRLATPPPSDRAAADPPHEAVAGLAAARQRTAPPPEAWAALLLEALVLGVPPDPKVERARAQARRGYPLVDPAVALEALARASDPEALEAAFDRALAATLGTVPHTRDLLAHPDGWQETVGALASAATERATALDAPAQVVAYGRITEALLGRSTGHAVVRGRAYARLGHDEAAFHWLAHARAEGASVPPEALRAVFHGFGDAEATADALAGPPGSRAAPGARAPTDLSALLGRRPDWGEAGIEPATLEGRWTLVSLWDTGCGGCLDTLGEAAAAAEQLRRDLRNVGHLAVSTDRDPRDFERAARLSRQLGTVTRSPGMARTLDLATSGVTLLVDPDGIIRVVNPSGLSLGQIEAAMKGVAPR